MLRVVVMVIVASVHRLGLGNGRDAQPINGGGIISF